MSQPVVGIIMGSQSDWPTLKPAAAILAELAIDHEVRIISAHRTPDRMGSYAKGAAGRGLKVIIAGAGGAAHLPGMTASMTTLPVLGVPVESKALKGMDSLLSIVQMPGGVPVATFAIGEVGREERRASRGRHSRPFGFRPGAAPHHLARAPDRRRRRVSVRQMSAPKILSAPVSPGGTIGILGGGQLGRMLAMAAARLGLKTHIYSDETDPPAFQVADKRTQGRYDDHAALAAFAKTCDAVTFEFENIPAETVEFVAALAPTNPGASALRITQDRVDEKSFVMKLGLATPAFAAVDSAADAAAAFDKLGGRAVLKTRRFGYDGKGQAKVASAQDARAAFESFKGAPCILEHFVDFDFEASVVAARGGDGAFAAYDPPENVHEHHILRRSIVPARLTTAQADAAKDIAKKIAASLAYVGVFAVELFVGKDGRLMVNEIAPRVHNSGHWTIDACLVSQFEQHIRAVAGWPLGNPARHSDALMENIIGAEANAWPTLAASGGALHLYGKSEARVGRKMGHITRLAPLTKR